jgi:hypothetical protein
MRDYKNMLLHHLLLTSNKAKAWLELSVIPYYLLLLKSYYRIFLIVVQVGEPK